MARLAAIDVGSTSVHLLVADVEDGDIRRVADESAFAGLGELVASGGLLAPGAPELSRLLDMYTDRAAELGASDVVLVATAPFRRAADAARVVQALRVPLHVVTPREEALLVLIGATGGRRPTEPVVVVDVGGGSTEVVFAAPDCAPEVTAVDVGAARLTGRSTPADHESLLADARDALAALAPLPARRVVAVGGTADNLAKLVGATRFGSAELRAALDHLASTMAASVATAYAMRPARVRLLPAGASILLALLERWGTPELEVSAAGLRDGAILAFDAAGHGWRDRLPALATRGCQRG